MDRLSLTVVSSSSAGAVSYSYTSGTNQLASLTDTAGTRSISYDGRGNTSSETRPGSITVATSYDGYGRLTDYDRSNIDDLDFAYNGLDDRVEMALGSDVRAFLYDADGRVMGEYGNSVSDVKAEFIWLNPMVAASGLFGGDDGIGGYAPLAVATPDSLGAIQVNWVHGNHLGVPLVTTDSGGSAATTPNDYFAPGFPGQSRALADLYYNRYRDYDPTTGRYIQADPIGLDGGDNIYLYAEANPVNLVDPTGEYAWIAAGLIGFGVGAAIEYFDNPCATAGDLLAAGAVGGLSSVGWGAAAGVGRGVALAGGRGIGWAGSKIAGKLSGRIGGLGGKGANGIKPKVGSAGGDGAGKGFPNKIKAQARSESSGTCVFCGTRTTNQSGPSRSEIDHAFPKSRGGNNTLNNAQNTCRTCNRSEGAKTTDEFLNK